MGRSLSEGKGWEVRKDVPNTVYRGAVTGVRRLDDRDITSLDVDNSLYRSTKTATETALILSAAGSHFRRYARRAMEGFQPLLSRLIIALPGCVDCCVPLSTEGSCLELQIGANRLCKNTCQPRRRSTSDFTVIALEAVECRLDGVQTAS